MKKMILLLIIGVAGCTGYEMHTHGPAVPYGPVHQGAVGVAQVPEEAPHVPAETTALSVDEKALQELRDLGLTPQEILDMIRTELQRRERADASEAVRKEEPKQPEAPVMQEQPPKTVVVKETVSEPVVIVVPSSNEGSSAAAFYKTLAPHGAWINLLPYGLVWQPTAARLNYSWRPYCDGGRWTWTNHGWSWKSSYTWGWAPFHYGRWLHHSRYRWVWVPGTTWSPAWVHWRRSSSHYGWAPLPPGADYHAGIGFSYHGKYVSLDYHFNLTDRHYTFVPHHGLLTPDLTTVRVRSPWTRKVFSDSVVVRHSHSSRDDTVHHRGIPHSDVVHSTRHTSVPSHVTRRSTSTVPDSRSVRINTGTGTGRASRVMDSVRKTGVKKTSVRSSAQPASRPAASTSSSSSQGRTSGEAKERETSSAGPSTESPSSSRSSSGSSRSSRVMDIVRRKMSK